MKVGERAARRRRLLAWSQRAALCIAAAVSIAVGIRVYESSPQAQARRPHGITIPAAIEQDMQWQQDRINGFIRTIKSISPVQLHHEHQPSIDEHQYNDDGGEMPADSDLIGPMRWV